MFVHKTNDPNDKSFDFQSIIKSLTGGARLQDILGKKPAEGNDDEGGLLGKIKGMFN